MSHGNEGEGSSQVLAEKLGITVEEVEQYVTLSTNESDDGLVYGYIVILDPSTPLDVLKKAGANSDRTVDLGPNIFDKEE